MLFTRHDHDQTRYRSNMSTWHVASQSNVLGTILDASPSACIFRPRFRPVDLYTSRLELPHSYTPSPPNLNLRAVLVERKVWKV